MRRSYVSKIWRSFCSLAGMALSAVLLAGCGGPAGVKDSPAAAVQLQQPVVESVFLAKNIGQGDYDMSSGDSLTFFAEDREVVSYVKYANLAGDHEFRWKWFDPEGNLYVDSGDHEIASPTGKYIEKGATWHKISVKDESAMTRLGDWRVEVYLDGSLAVSKNFAIQELPFDIAQVPGSGTKRPDAVAVVIGNKNYEHGDVPDVEFAHADAELIKQYLVKTLGFREGNIIFRKDIKKIDFEELFGIAGNHKGLLYDYIKPGKSDVFIYYSGHGAPDLDSQTGYFVPVNCGPERISLTGYSLDLFYENLSRLPSRQNIVVLDTCFSGRSASGDLMIKNASPVVVNLKNPAVADGKTIVLASAEGNQISSWYNEKKHGLFTWFFLKALHGKADANQDRTITMREVYDFVSDRAEGVPYWARRLHGNRDQTPVLLGLADADYELVTYK